VTHGGNQERRIKRKILGVPQTALIRFPKGLGDVCFAETQAALAAERLKAAFEPKVALTASAVEVSGAGLGDLVALALGLTTAREILWQVQIGKAETATQLAARLKGVDWDLYLPAGAEVGIRVASTASRLFHEGRLRDTVAKTLEEHGVRAGAVKGATHLLDVRLVHDVLAFSLSLSGRPLYQRRVKAELGGSASVKEDIAAGATRLALAWARAKRGDDWRPEHIVAPFAGSGTLGFEAVIAICGIPPAVFFGPLSVEAFPCCPSATVGYARRRLIGRWIGDGSNPKTPTLTFIDNDPEASSLLERNGDAFRDKLVKAGGPAIPCEVKVGDALKLLPALVAGRGSHAFVPLNPPYGRRLKGPASTPQAQARLGAALAAAGAAGYALLGSEEAAQAFCGACPPGATSVREVLHGGKTVRLVCFA
jgi:23S rRNA G2445 N2-methylase RlmL